MTTKSKKQKGTDYELFVQGIYKTLMASQGVQNIAIEHDKEVAGKSGCDHQIDVYWEFKVAGQTYRTAIECKHFDQNVPIGRIRDFYGVLADVPGLQGIFVSLNGFQVGAKKYAAHYGIRLLEVRPPSPVDWEGRVKDIHLNIAVVMPEITKFEPNFTRAFLSTLAQGQSQSLQFAGTNHESIIVDANGKHIASYEEIRVGLPHGLKAEQHLTHTIPYSGCFMVTTSGNIPIDSVSLTYDVHIEAETIEILGEQVAQAIMKDVATGDITVFSKDGRVHEVRK